MKVCDNERIMNVSLHVYDLLNNAVSSLHLVLMSKAAELHLHTQRAFMAQCLIKHMKNCTFLSSTDYIAYNGKMII
jgi:hypothetical protein